MIATTAKARNGMTRKPMTRTDHPKPSEEPLSIFDKTMGIIIPPIDDPDMTTPRAAARFLSKYCDTAAIAGNCRNPMTIPIRTPCTSMTSQYFLHRLSIIMAKTYATAAGSTICYYVSKLRIASNAGEYRVVYLPTKEVE